MFSPLSWYVNLGLLMTSFTETEELEDDSLRPVGEDPHAVLQLLVSPLKHTVRGPQVLYGRHVQKVVLWEPRIEGLEFICNRTGNFSSVFKYYIIYVHKNPLSLDLISNEEHVLQERQNIWL